MTAIKPAPAGAASQTTPPLFPQPAAREPEPSWSASLLTALRIPAGGRSEPAEAPVSARRVARADATQRRRDDELGPGGVNVASINAQKLQQPASKSELAQAGDPDAQPRTRERTRSSPSMTSQATSPAGASGAEAAGERGHTLASAAGGSAGGANASATAGAPQAASRVQAGGAPAAAAPGVAPSAGAAGRVPSGVAGAAAASGAKHAAVGIAQHGQRTGAFEKLLKASEPQRSSAQRTHVAQSALQGVSMALRSNGGDAVIRLTPEGLGGLRVHVSVRDARVSATFTTTTEPAREMLENSRTMLRDALEARGLHVDQIVVQGPGTEARPDSTSNAQGPSAFAGDADGRRDASRDPQHAGHDAARGHPMDGSAIVSGDVPDAPPDTDRIVWVLA